MAFKQFEVERIGLVTVYKRRGTRSLRLSIRHDGSLRVTVPAWSSYAAGVNFARSRADWILKHAQPAKSLLTPDQAIGKAHRLSFAASGSATRASGRLKGTAVIVTYPQSLDISDARVQKAAQAASVRALRAQAEKLLPIRLAELAAVHGFRYRSVAIKQLKTRWGSCDQDRNIALNLYLMQLPWRLIDYVLLHELTHTRVMKHGPEFWAAMVAIEPKTPELRREIRTQRPVLG